VAAVGDVEEFAVGVDGDFRYIIPAGIACWQRGQRGNLLQRAFLGVE
jgi:hypothetical protein